MTAPVTNSPKTTDPTTQNLANTASTIGKDQFLELLVAQLKNQDPTSPMDGTQFAAQLAQFSTVEQLIDMNNKMDAQTSASAQGQIAQQASFANTLIGRDVILNGAKANIADDGTGRINVDLDGAAKSVHVDILGSDGKTVLASQDIDNVAAGSQTIALAFGKLPSGSYSYKVTAVDKGGKPLTITGNTVGTVQSMVFQNGQVMLRVDGSVVPVTDVTEILPAAVAAGSSSSTN
jgi:flagellar basal-body rod modification protein FlgD